MNDENKRAGANNVSEPFNLRLPHKTREKLDAVAAMLPILSAHRIALAALDIGLDALAANPSKVLSVEVAPRGGASMRGAAGAAGAGPGSAGMRGAMGAGPRSASTRGAAGASGAATDDQMPEEPPLVRAPSVPPRRATLPPALDPSRFSSPLPALPSMPPPRVPADIEVPEAVELDDDHEEPRAKHARAVAAVRAQIAALQAANPKMSNKKIGTLAGLSNAPVDKIMNGGNVRPATLAAIASILPPEHTGKAST